MVNCTKLGYASKKVTLRFGMFFRNACAAQLHHKSEGFFRESEGFFWRSGRLKTYVCTNPARVCTHI